MSQWSDFYKSRVGESYPEYVIKRYETFLKELVSYSHIREEGCGIGSISKAITMIGCLAKIDCFDIDKDQIELAKLNLNSNKPYVGDIFKNHGKVDLIFSHGVLEHFNDNQIKEILNRQKSEANKVVHYIPSNKYLTRSFGDERLLSKDYWKNVFNPKEIIEFNEGFDLVAIW